MKKNRRSFLRDWGMGATAFLATPLGSGALGGSAAGVSAAGASAQKITLGKDIEIELLTAGDLFLGIGSVAIHKTPLRDGKAPMCFDIRNPDGIAVTARHIVEKSITPERIVLQMNMSTITSGPMDWMVHSVRNREALYGWNSGEQLRTDTLVTLEILPVSRRFGQTQFTGFSYQYTFSSPSFPIYRISDRSTWEINAAATGNECWMRVGHIPSIVPVTGKDQHYSTESYRIDLPNPNIFQFLPLQTELQGFTFQAHAQGILVTWPTEVGHIRTLIEKPRGQEHIFHFHQHCNDLANRFRTSPVEVLWAGRRDTSRVDRYNIYEETRSAVHAHLHAGAGIQQERVTTYGIIEEWSEPDLDRYTEKILPQFISKGIRRIFLPNEFQNTMNTWGVSNMCCNVDYRFPAGTREKMERFCRAASEAGIRVDMWGNTAISTLTEMFRWRDGQPERIDFLPEEDTIAEVLKKSADPYVRNPSNAIEGDHYTPRFAVLNIRDPDIRAYWMKQWKAALDTGVQGIFLDSSFNMTSDKFHFIQNTEHNRYSDPASAPVDPYRPADQPAPAILTLYHAHIGLIREMQQMGFSYCGEDLGVFGIHRHGPDVGRVIDSLPIWNEAMIVFDEQVVRAAGMDPLLVFFKGLAYRMMWMLQWDFKQESLALGIKDERAFAFLNAFNQVGHLMEERTILSGERAVTYHPAGDERTAVWWVFSDMLIPVPPGSLIKDVMASTEHRADSIDARAQYVYLVTA